MANIALRRFLRRGLVLLALLFFSAPQSVADTYSFDFTGELEIWDLSGTYTDDSIGCTISYDLAQDAQGKITGYGTASCTTQGVDIDMTFDINGSVRQTNEVAIVKLVLNFQGTADDGYEVYPFKACEKVTAQIDSGAGLITGEVKIKVCIKGLGCESFRGSFEGEIPADMDGSSTFEFEVTADGKKLVGTGELTLSNDDTYQFSATGKFKDKTNTSKFTFQGEGSAEKCKLSVQVDEDDGHIIKLKGKMLGQKLKAENIGP
jgi:hypothetical protein